MIEAQRERTIRWDDPAPSAAAAREMKGVDFLRAIVEGTLPPPPMMVTLGLRMVEADEGRVVFEGDPAEYHYNPMGAVHGGFALALFDSALGCAVQSLLPAGALHVTSDVHVRLIRPITAATGTVRCEAHARHAGRTTGVAEASLYDAAGKLLGTGSAGCAVLRP